MRERNAEYEFIRVISMVFVIGVHAFHNVSADYAAGTLPGQMISTVFFLCNGLFFMLSGKFALSVNCCTWDAYKRYYLKRIGSIGIPVLVCMMLRSMYNAAWWWDHILSVEFLKEYIQNVLYNFSECEYWFLYHLVGYLAVAPFIGKVLQRANRAELILFTGIGVLYNGLTVYLSAAGYSSAWMYPLGSWFVLFALGYALEKILETKRQENILLILGLFCFAVSILLKHLGLTAGIHDRAPTYVCMTCAAFVAMKRLYRPGKIADAAMIRIGGLSLSVYLLHMIVLYNVLPYVPQWPVIPRLAALMMATVMVSLAVGFVLDRTVFCVLLWLYRKMVGLNLVKK